MQQTNEMAKVQNNFHSTVATAGICC